LLVDFSWDRTTNPLNSIKVAGVPTVTSQTSFVSFALQQSFTEGGNLTMSLSNQRQASSQLGLIYNPDVISRLAFTGVQPLINRAGFAYNRVFINVARNGIQITREGFRQQVAAILAQAESSYWDLAVAQAQVRSAEEALAVAQQLNEENQKRLKAGVLSEVDAKSAGAEVAARRRDLIIVQTNLQYSEVALKNLFSRQITDAIGSARIVTTDPLPVPAEGDIPPLQQAVAAAMENRPEIPQAEGNIKNQQIAVSFTHNGLRPTVNLFGLFALAGISGNHLLPNPAGGPPILQPGGLGQELTQVWRSNNPEYAFGFGVSIPLRNRAAQADNARAQLSERQAEVALQQTRKSIGLDVHNTIISLNQARAQVQAAITAAEYSQQNRDAEEKKLQAGVSTSYNLILTERDLLAAQLAEAQARGAYAKAIVTRDLVEGVTLEKSHFTLEDALRGRIAESSAAAPVR